MNHAAHFIFSQTLMSVPWTDFCVTMDFAETPLAASPASAPRAIFSAQRPMSVKVGTKPYLGCYTTLSFPLCFITWEKCCVVLVLLGLVFNKSCLHRHQRVWIEPLRERRVQEQPGVLLVRVPCWQHTGQLFDPVHWYGIKARWGIERCKGNCRCIFGVLLVGWDVFFGG